jgi:hypothetical protein
MARELWPNNRLSTTSGDSDFYPPRIARQCFATVRGDAIATSSDFGGVPFSHAIFIEPAALTTVASHALRVHPPLRTWPASRSDHRAAFPTTVLSLSPRPPPPQPHPPRRLIARHPAHRLKDYHPMKPKSHHGPIHSSDGFLRSARSRAQSLAACSRV